MTAHPSVAVHSPVISTLTRWLRATLTHPVTMRIKRQLRDGVWRFKGTRVQNPPLPDRVDAVLFVCLGNICRSPFAALVARRQLAAAGRSDLVCASAGIRPSQAARPPLEARAAATAHGIDLDGHVPQPLTPELLAAHDIVFVMEVAQLEYLRAAYPEFRARMFLLSLYDAAAAGAYERCHIADPFGQRKAAFDDCYARVTRAVAGWLLASGIARPATNGPWAGEGVGR